MKFARVYFAVIAAITLLLGVILLLAPGFTSGIFFDSLDNDALFFVRVCGATLLGYATLNYFSVKSNNLTVFKIVAWSNLVTLITALGLSLLARAEFDHNMWLFSLQHAVFAGGFACVLVKLR